MSAIRSIVVVGNGVAAALAAALLACRLERTGISVTLIAGGSDPHGLGPVGSAIATRPGFGRVLSMLGLDEQAVLVATDGAYTLGPVFSGWRGDGHGWMLPHGAIGAPIGPVAFNQLVHRLRSEGHGIALADFAIAAVAAQSDRFALPGDDPASVSSLIDHGLSFDTALLTVLLQQLAVSKGVRIDPRSVIGVERDDDGIARLRTDCGSAVTGDFFVDATGDDALLTTSPWQDWRAWFPCDRALIGSVADGQAPLPFTHCGATADGWRLSVPSDGARSDILFQASAYGSDEAMAERFAIPVDRSVYVPAGRRATFWDGNCVAIGTAGCAIEPLHAVALHNVADAIDRLVTLFPDAKYQPILASEYDRQTVAQAERTRDFALLHYRLAGRDEPMWHDTIQAPLPDSVAWKLDQYRSRGRITLYDDETFDRDEWVMLLDAMGVRARRHDALADLIPGDQLVRHLSHLRGAIVEAVRAMPTHQAALRAAKSFRSVA